MNWDFLYLMKPELVLTVLIFIFLFAKIGNLAENTKGFLQFANLLLAVNFISGFFMNKTGVAFSNMYHTDMQLILEKNILNFALLLISLLSYEWLNTGKNAAEFYMLLLSSQLGMFFMISSGNLLMFYLAMELSTIPLAALSNFDPDKPRSAEAAFKSIMSSAFASGIMLFGISLLYGSSGTIDFAGMIQAFAGGGSHLQIMAFVFFFVGFAFKLSLVPFHLWTADVYEGSPVSITATLAVISKGTFIFVAAGVLFSAFSGLVNTWQPMLMLLIAITITIGNFMAVRQSNLKRLLAFSSISQMGYVLLGMLSFRSDMHIGLTSIVYFLVIYIFSSLAMFAVVSIVFYRTGKDDIADYRGFYQNNKLLSWVIAIALFSLAGIPPTAGFFGKYFLLTSGAMGSNYAFMAIAVLNMVVSLYYYLRVVKAIFIDKSETPVEKVNVSAYSAATIVICVAGILVCGIWGQVFEYVNSFFALHH